MIVHNGRLAGPSSSLYTVTSDDPDEVLRPTFYQKIVNSPRLTNTLLIAIVICGVTAGMMVGVVLTANADQSSDKSALVLCGMRARHLARIVNTTASFLSAVAMTLPDPAGTTALSWALNVTLAAGFRAVVITAPVRNITAGQLTYPILASSRSRDRIGANLHLRAGTNVSDLISTNGTVDSARACPASGAAVIVVARGVKYILVAPVCVADVAGNNAFRIADGGRILTGSRTTTTQPSDTTTSWSSAAAVPVTVLDRTWAVQCSTSGQSAWPTCSPLPMLFGVTVTCAVLALALLLAWHFAQLRRSQADWGLREADLRRRNQEMTKAEGRRTLFVELLCRRLQTISKAVEQLATFNTLPAAGTGVRLSRDQRSSLRLMEQHANLINSICDQVLDLTNIDNGHFQLDHKPFSLHSVFNRLDNRMRPIAESKGLRFMLVADETLPASAIGDERRLDQILFNAVSNAIKFTEHGAITVSARTVAVRLDHETGMQAITIEFVVTDTGLGFSPAMIASLMNVSDDFMATGKIGLGFVTMKKLCTLMGGNVTVESEPGLSSRVRLLVVVEYGRACIDFELALAQSPVTSPRSSITTTTSAKAPIDVLLVEDNVTSAKIAQRMMENVPVVNATLVEDGIAALAAVGVPDPGTKLADFALVLMDVSLPKLDGNEATRRMRSAGLTIPIIGMTASALAHQHRESLQSGMNDILMKPFSRQQLLQMIRSYGKVVIDDDLSMATAAAAATTTTVAGSPADSTFQQARLPSGIFGD